MKLDGAPSGGETGRRRPVQPMRRPDQTALQSHKWVDYLTVKRSDVAIGDWVIAERVVATRGEPIGRQRVELPYWRRQQNRFTMLADRSARPDDKKYVAAVDVPFTPDGKEPILVDFTGGDSPVEVLLCIAADGKLIARNSAVDAADRDPTIRRLQGVCGRRFVLSRQATTTEKRIIPGK